jgi:hypothetical protein
MSTPNQQWYHDPFVRWDERVLFWTHEASATKAERR